VKWGRSREAVEGEDGICHDFHSKVPARHNCITLQTPQGALACVWLQLVRRARAWLQRVNAREMTGGRGGGGGTGPSCPRRDLAPKGDRDCLLLADMLKGQRHVQRCRLREEKQAVELQHTCCRLLEVPMASLSCASLQGHCDRAVGCAPGEVQMLQAGKARGRLGE
jgi:hypothetical protein